MDNFEKLFSELEDMKETEEKKEHKNPIDKNLDVFTYDKRLYEIIEDIRLMIDKDDFPEVKAQLLFNYNIYNNELFN